MFGEKYDFSTTWRLFGTADPLERVKRVRTPATVAARWSADEARCADCARSICCIAKARGP
jgi:hypothetical protein